MHSVLAFDYYVLSLSEQPTITIILLRTLILSFTTITQVNSEEEVEGTRSPEHLRKSTRSRYTPSRSVRLRETKQSETDVSRHLPKKGRTSSSNFELTFNNGHIKLLHKGKKIIDLSNPEKQIFYHSMTLKLEHNSLKIINSSGYTQRKYDRVKSLITFDGRHISEYKGATVRHQLPKANSLLAKTKPSTPAASN